jgi:hypothetical protein
VATWLIETTWGWLLIQAVEYIIALAILRALAAVFPEMPIAVGVVLLVLATVVVTWMTFRFRRRLIRRSS